MPVAASDIAAIADADARENWQMLIDFRDHLLRHKTLEAAYADLVRHDLGKTPPLFVNQLVHVILRNALDGVERAARAARRPNCSSAPQRVTLHDNSLLAADEETIGGVNTAPVTPLVSMLGHSGRSRNRHASTTTTPTAIGSAATGSTWRST